MATTAINKETNFSGHEWVWVLITGIVYILLGFFAISVPVASTIGVTYGLAAVLIVGGIIHFVHAVQLRHGRGGITRFFQSIIAVVTGLLMALYPGAGMQGVALALSFYFFLGAAANWILYFAMRPHRGWGWGIASSILSFALGVYILWTFPFSALWIPGTLLGIDLVMAGSMMIGFSLSIRKIRNIFIDSKEPKVSQKNSPLKPLEGT